MPEDFGKDMLMLGGTVVGFIAALLTLMEKLLDVKNRVASLTSKKERKSPSSTERPAPDSPPTIDFFSSKPFRGVSYLLLYETSVIVAAGLLLNYVGLTLSRHLESILFLDMTGTALVAVPLGPLVGAIVALLSNSAVNWLLYPETGADVVIFPWSLVKHGRRLLLGLDGQTNRLSKVSPQRTQFRSVPCLVSLYFWGRRRDRHEPAGNLCPGCAA